jgi:transposase
MTRQQQEERILRYRNEGLSFRAIAQRTGLTKYQVEKVLQSNSNIHTEKNLIPRLLEPHREQILQWMDIREMSIRLIYQRLCEKKIQVSESSVRRYLRTLKKPEVYVHVPTTPGQECQIDFGYLGKFRKDGKDVKVWVFCQVLSHSRYAFYKAVTNQTTETFFRCQIEAMEFFGGVPSSLKIDNLGAGVLLADFYQPLIQKQYADMVAHYKTTVVTCRIARGQDKGIVESGIKYVKNSFLKNLETRELDALKKELAYWNKTVCNLRVHGTLRATPLDIFIKEEKKHLLPLPLKRYELLRYELRTVNQFGHIYYKYNQYSVPAHFAGENVLIASNGAVLKVMKDGVQVALHMINPHRGKNITLDHHQPIYKQAKTTEYYRQLIEPIGQHALALFERLVDTYPFEWKRMCNGIRQLSQKYSQPLMNEACKRVLSSYRPDYRQVKEQVENLVIPHLHSQPGTDPLTKINGYAHDLSQYDRFVTLFVD